MPQKTKQAEIEKFLDTHPRASLNEIAKGVGCSNGTAHKNMLKIRAERETLEMNEECAP